MPKKTSPSAGRVLRAALTQSGRGPRLALATFGYVVHEAAEAGVPILVGVVIDRALVPGDPVALAVWLAVLAVNFVVLSLSYRWAARLMVSVYGYGENDLRTEVLGRVLHPHGTAISRSPGDLLTVTTSDTYRVAGVSWMIVQQGATVAGILVASIALLLISAPLGIGVLVASVLVLLGMHRASRPIEQRGAAEQRAAGVASAVATDLVSGLRVIRGLRAQREAERRYRNASVIARDGAIAANRGIQLYLMISFIVSGCFLAALALAAGILALNGVLSLGALVTVVGLAQYLQGSLSHVGTFASSWLHKRASARRIAEVLGEEPRVPVLGSSRTVSRAAAGQSLGFRWAPEGGVLVEAAPGETIAIVPRDPAHARRIADRLSYRSALEPGEIVVGGTDAHELGPHEYRALVVAPPHDALVFAGSLDDNLFGGEGRERAARAAALEDVLGSGGVDGAGDGPVGSSGDSPGAGWGRQAGEAGRRLSGGQRQRLLLTRVLAAGAPVVILDEPGTALDAATEQRVAAGLRDHASTTILITRSPILLAACDRVVVAPDAARDAAPGLAGEAESSPHQKREEQHA